MTTINYTINFFSEWHTGSGLTSGSDLDALVIKDRDGLPYIPGRTLKGLLKEAADELSELGLKEWKPEFIQLIFGKSSGNPKNSEDISDPEENDPTQKGSCFFSNATLSSELSTVVLTNQLSSFFYRSIASTAIESNRGIAKKHSLRIMETTIPCVLYAEIADFPENPEFRVQLDLCMKWIKRLGQNRNRGLGRCQFELKEKETAK